MVPMDLVAVIRHKVHAEGVPIREVARELGLSRNTIRRYARAKRVPVDRSLQERSTPVRDGGGRSGGLDLEVASVVHGR
jgi:predicted transcriptional regulator